MPLDIYDPCPCGSGKKLKFCCQSIADEMDRALRLMDGNQPRVALQQLESLARKHPQNAWIGSTRGLILLELGEASAARDVLRALLEHHPDHEFGIVLLATATFQADGLDSAKKSIHRAFQRSAKKFPSMVSGLAATMAAIFAQRDNLMAAREHMALALRLSPEEHRQELFVKLLEFDGNEGVPYPLRGSHVLPAVEGTDDQQKEIRKAQKYAAVGCWNTAADLFQALTRSITDSAALWHCVGLCRAWDGDEVAAAEALHRAAQLYADFPTAVECEALAQLFDRFHTKDVVEICTYEAKVESIGRFLTVLDAHPQFVRLAVPDSHTSEQNRPVATYQVLDRPQTPVNDFSLVVLDSLPRLQAHMSVYDAIPEDKEPPWAFLTGDRGAELEDARKLLDSTVQGLLHWSTDKAQPEVTGSLPKELVALRWRWSLPDGLPRQIERELHQGAWKRAVTEIWPNTPLQGLGGRRPSEAAADATQRTALTAATYLLDAYCQQQGYELDLNAALARLNLEPLAPLEVDETTQLSMQSVMQMHRLPIERLSDSQLVSVVNRAMLTHHRRFLYHVLKVALDRPGCAAELDLQRVYPTIVELCAHTGRREEALHWVAVARSKPPQEGSQFEYQWNWDTTELTLRLETPDDPALKPLLDRFVHYYSPKVPQMRGFIEKLLKTFGAPSPWESVSVITSSTLSSAASGTLWSPAAEQAPATGASKLWLPGQ